MLKGWWLRLLGEDRASDPIDHPALMRMSSDELADLPLRPLDDRADQSVRLSTLTSAVTELPDHAPDAIFPGLDPVPSAFLAWKQAPSLP